MKALLALAMRYRLLLGGIVLVLVLVAVFYWVDPGGLASKVGLKSGYGFPIRGGKVGRDWSKHRGWDIGAPYGKPIYSPAVGVVSYVRQGHKSCGNYVQVKFPEGNKMNFCHMSKTKALRGDEVTKNTVLGYVGSSGFTIPPGNNHLHITAYDKEGKVSDPGRWLPRSD